MKCIECREFEANKESGLCDTCEDKESRKINGVLYLPALGLLVSIIGRAFQLCDFSLGMFNHFNKTGFLSYYAIGASILLMIGFITSLYAAGLFFRRKKGTRQAMVIYYAIGSFATLYLTVIPYFVFNYQFSVNHLSTVVSGLVVSIIWIPYFLFSKRIDIVFCR